MGSKISYKLNDLGFFSALGTSEHSGMTRQAVHVMHGTPHTYDMNNGVTVVYDEEGRPWIRRWGDNDGVTARLFEGVIHTYSLERGAYVPHSNDGGWFVRKVIPNL